MSYWKQFVRFDPVSGKVPHQPFSYMQDIAKRARALVSKRTKAEIEGAANLVDWMIEQHYEVIGLDPSEVYGLSDVWILKQCINAFELDDEDFTQGQDYEYFAVLALWKIGDVLNVIHPDKEQSELTMKLLQKSGMSPKSSEHAVLGYANTRIGLSIAGDYALEAMYAVCLAEELYTRANLNIKVEQATKEKISLNAKKAATVRHQKTRELRTMAEDLYRRGTWPSIRQAAKKIYPLIEVKGQDIGFKFSPERGEHTVYDWLRKAAKKPC